MQQPSEQAGILASDPFGDLEIPAELQSSLDRHRQNLAHLIVSLKSAGLSEDQIESSVSVVVTSYKDELTRAIKMMMR